jgi:tetratricopeptide (TPR) repeat protein
MNSIEEKIQAIEAFDQQINDALWSLEMKEKIDQAYEIYQGAEKKLIEIEIPIGDPAYLEQQRVLAYCLMRLGNLLRQKGKTEEALALSEREIAAARASEDEIMLARSLMSNGTNWLITGEIGKGTSLLEEARKLFESGESYDHQQGAGWYWILQADLANAGLIKKENPEILAMTDRALTILKPIENWPGVVRAYAARVKVHERMGNEAESNRDRQEQEYYRSKVSLDENDGDRT